MGADLGRAQRRALPAAARPRSATRRRCPTGASPRSPTPTRWRSSGAGRPRAARWSRSRPSPAPMPCRRRTCPRGLGVRTFSAGHRHLVEPHLLLRPGARGRRDAGRHVERARGGPSRRRGGGPGSDRRGAEAPVVDDVPSPMTDLPSSATFGSLVHGVLEEADPFAPDLLAELTRHVLRAAGVVAGRRERRGHRRRSGPAARHAPRSARPRPDPRRDRPARPAARARLRDPAGRRRRAWAAPTYASPTSASC